jgi:hypothetical protein
MAAKKVLVSLNSLLTETRKDTVEKLGLFLKTNLPETDPEKLDQLLFQFSDELHNDNDIFASSKSKKKKEKNSRPPTAYNLFVKAKMEEIKSQNPDLKNTELMAKAAQCWKQHKLDMAGEAAEATDDTDAETEVKNVVLEDAKVASSDAEESDAPVQKPKKTKKKAT